MDVILEIVDTFLFDRLYATVFPTTIPVVISSYARQTPTATSTFSSMREVPTPFQPASQFLTLEPSAYAYLSAWPRDNPFRQLLSLYLITW